MPLLYNASCINLNITNPQLRTAINQRVFDVSACGAFLLSDYRRDLETLFEPGEIVYYRNKEELRQKAGYYLKHSEERESIAQTAQRKVLKEHTWILRAKELIEIMTR